MRIRRLLVPTDFSVPADRATDYAARLAARLGAEIVLLFVEGLGYYGPGLDWLSAEAAERMLQGIPWQAIGDTAARLGADWIVMATHGRTGLARALLGSVTENVVRTAPCPVLTLRAQGVPRRGAASWKARKGRVIGKRS
jgi:nucleotide-binding universal stress UspA family protein